MRNSVELFRWKDFGRTSLGLIKMSVPTVSILCQVSITSLFNFFCVDNKDVLGSLLSCWTFLGPVFTQVDFFGA